MALDIASGLVAQHELRTLLCSMSSYDTNRSKGAWRRRPATVASARRPQQRPHGQHGQRRPQSQPGEQ